MSVKNSNAEKSENIRTRVEKARKVQEKRYGKEILNSNIGVKEINKYIILNNEQKKLLEDAAKKLDFSPRVFHKILKIAQTIADLDNGGEIKDGHILEALQYRPKEII